MRSKIHGLTLSYLEIVRLFLPTAMVRPSLEGGDFLLLIKHELRRLYSYSSGNFLRRPFLTESKQPRLSMVSLILALSASALRRAVRSRRP